MLRVMKLRVTSCSVSHACTKLHVVKHGQTRSNTTALGSTLQQQPPLYTPWLFLSALFQAISV
jgi:hypothetical protein